MGLRGPGKGCPELARVRLVEGPLGGRFPFSNCLLIESPRARILVDTGCGEALQRYRDSIDLVLYTHFHPDHIRGFHVIRDGVRIAAPLGERAYTSLEDLAKRFAPRVYEEWLKFVDVVMGLRGVPEPTDYFDLGADYCFRDICISLVPARGHLSTHSILIVGDHVHLTDIDLTSFGPWYGNPESDLALLLSDIVMASKIEGRRYTTSHKPRVYGRNEVLSELASYSGKVFYTASRLVEALAESEEPLTPESLAGRGIIYRKYLGGVETIMKYFEAVMIEKLLGLLSYAGCVERYGQGFRAKDRECGWLWERKSFIEGEILSQA